ncbi:MAG TPA: MFS transporter [Candidatus Dormibacteraeota bacterium]|nr:MFS transporter [Candidatus Dormibacteraeota bacterium]
MTAVVLPAAQRRRVLSAAVVGGFVVVACWTGLTPLYPELAATLRVRADLLGTIVGLAAVISIACQIPVGVLIDRLGARPFLVAGLALTTVATVIRAMAPNIVAFALGQMMMGLAVPLYAAGSITAVAAAYGEVRRGTPLGYIQSGTGLGQATAFLVIGSLGSVMTWRQLSAGMGLLPLLVLPMAAIMPDPILRVRVPIASAVLDSLRFLASRGPAQIALVTAGALAAGNAALYVLPFALRGASMGAGARGLLLLPYFLGAIVGAPFAGRAVGWLGYRATLGGLLPMGSAAAMAMATAGVHPAVVVASCFALGASAMSTPALAAGLAARSARALSVPTGAALGGVRLAQTTGPALGPGMAGVIYVHAGTSVTLVVIAVLFFAAAGVGALAPLAVVAERSATGPDPLSH